MKLPIYFFLEISNGVTQDKIDILSSELKSLLSYLKMDPELLEVGFISIIVVNEIADQVLPLTHISDLILKPFRAYGKCDLGESLDYLADCIEREVKFRSSQNSRRDRRPYICVIADNIFSHDWRLLPSLSGDLSNSNVFKECYFSINYYSSLDLLDVFEEYLRYLKIEGSCIVSSQIIE